MTLSQHGIFEERPYLQYAAFEERLYLQRKVLKGGRSLQYEDLC